MSDNTSGTPVMTASDDHPRDKDGKLPQRRTKLTAERAEKIADSRRKGHTLEVSANKAGIARKTLHMWMNKGAEVIEKVHDEDHPATEPSDVYAWGRRYSKFYLQMVDAETDFREKLENQILDAGFGRGTFAEDADWRALKWYAETVLGGEYSPKEEVKHTHEVAGTVEVSPQLGDGPPDPDEEPMTKEEALEAYEGEREPIEADYEVVDGEE